MSDQQQTPPANPPKSQSQTAPHHAGTQEQPAPEPALARRGRVMTDPPRV